MARPRWNGHCALRTTPLLVTNGDCQPARGVHDPESKTQSLARRALGALAEPQPVPGPCPHLLGARHQVVVHPAAGQREHLVERVEAPVMPVLCRPRWPVSRSLPHAGAGLRRPDLSVDEHGQLEPGRHAGLRDPRVRDRPRPAFRHSLRPQEAQRRVQMAWTVAGP